MLIYMILLLSFISTVSNFCKHPPGKYCFWGSKKQLDCPKGSYCPKNARFYNSCPVGTYLDEYGKSEITHCKNCTAGRYCSRRGLELPNGFCKPGYFCPVGSRSSTEQSCPRDHFCPRNSSQAYPCPKGQVQSEPKQYFCHHCPRSPIFNFSYAPKVIHVLTNVTFSCSVDCNLYTKLNISYSIILKLIYASKNFQVLTSYTGSYCGNVTANVVVNSTASYSVKCLIKSICGKSESVITFKASGKKTAQFSNKNYVVWYVVGGVGLFVIILAIIVLYYIRSKFRSDMDKGSPTMRLRAGNLHSSDDDVAQVKKSKIAEIDARTTQNMCKSVNSALSQNGYEYDVFICYSSVDRIWVKNTLLPNLENNGLKVCIDFRDFLVGVYIIENITNAIFNSGKTLAVLSPDFVNSIYCRSELSQAMSRLDEHQVIPILYKPCEVPEVLSHVTYLDWCHPDIQPHFWDILLKSVQNDE